MKMRRRTVPPGLVSALGILLTLVATPADAQGRRDPGCRVMGDVETVDARRGLAACERARERFAELFGAPVPRVRLVVEPRRGYRTGTASGRAVVLWPSSKAMVRTMGDDPAGTNRIAAQWREVLPHEIVHALVATRFYPGGELPEGYGTPLPDWLEEGAAIWAEPLDSRRARLASAGDLPPGGRDLRRILTGEHPAAADPEIYAVRDGGAPPADQALWDFYPQSIAVVAFIHEHGGPAAFRELVRRLDDDPEDPAALLGLPGLPSRMDGMVAAWEEWLVARRHAR